jgi:Helix-turn-helix.
MHTKLSDAVAERVRRYRLRADLTREQLAERCAALGAPDLTAAAITNIETGRRNRATGVRRREVTVDELVVLAKALGVPPILLIYPVGEAETCEVLPGRTMGTWAAVRWFTGEAPFASQGSSGEWFVTPDDFAAWERGAAPVDDYRRHDELVRDFNAAAGRAGSHHKAAMVGDERERGYHLRLAERAEQERREAERALRDLRQNMRRRGVMPPAMRGALAGIDDLTTAESSEV